MKTIDYVCAATMVVLTLVAAWCIVDTLMSPLVGANHEAQRARILQQAEQCDHLYDVGKSAEWAECMGVPYQ